MEPIALTDIEIFIRLAVALVLGAFLGLERTFAGKTAGMRTFALVSMGAALFIVVATQFVFSTLPNEYDPVRVISAVVSGIGFIGAGLIIFSGQHVHGLTTAAGMWVAAGIGLAVGAGFVTIAVYTTFLTLFVFTVLWFVEDKFKDVAEADDKELSRIVEPTKKKP